MRQCCDISPIDASIPNRSTTTTAVSDRTSPRSERGARCWSRRRCRQFRSRKCCVNPGNNIASIKPPISTHTVMADWRSESYRDNIVAKLNSHIVAGQQPMRTDARQMEANIFHKARSEHEYMAYIARLIVYIRGECRRRRMDDSCRFPSISRVSIPPQTRAKPKRSRHSMQQTTTTPATTTATRRLTSNRLTATIR